MRAGRRPRPSGQPAPSPQRGKVGNYYPCRENLCMFNRKVRRRVLKGACSVEKGKGAEKKSSGLVFRFKVRARVQREMQERPRAQIESQGSC
jgi:hypothetical protein